MPVNTIVKTSANPAAGALASWTADEDVFVNSVVWQLVNSSAVANRRMGLQAKDASGNIFYWQYASGDVVASATMNYCAFAGAPTYALQVTVQTLSLPQGGLRLRKNDILTTIVNNLDAGDDISAMVLLCERPVY